MVSAIGRPTWGERTCAVAAAEKQSCPMPGPREPLLIASDVHLEPEGSARSAGRLARLLMEHAGHELVLAGDVFNLSLDRPSRDPGESAQTTLRSYPELIAALRQHLAAGHGVTFV